jgi:hypothetical protein
MASPALARIPSTPAVWTDASIWQLTKFIWKLGVASILVWAIPLFALFMIGAALTHSH